jgi:hypothetical protein
MDGVLLQAAVGAAGGIKNDEPMYAILLIKEGRRIHA